MRRARLLLVIASARALVLHVGRNADARGGASGPASPADGGPASPFATLNDAKAHIVDHELTNVTVLIAPGRYSTGVEISLSTSDEARSRFG